LKKYLTMKKLSFVLTVLFMALAIFFLFAQQTNVKGMGAGAGSAPTTPVEETYNFEFKYGFPTPWYSRYYLILDPELRQQYAGTNIFSCRLFDMRCSKVKTPPESMLVSKNLALNILWVQLLLAIIASLTLTGLGYGGAVFYKHAHNRH
jgi:hypothetical protein